MTATTIIGIDMSTRASKTWLSRAMWRDGETKVEQVIRASTGTTPLATLIDLLPATGRTLLAIDAPLGWPTAMGPSLAQHRAGEPLTIESRDLFLRRTDERILEELGKHPFWVGADKIGRTAHAALALIGALREAVPAGEFPLLDNRDFSGTGFIEVYPGATLTALGLDSSGYKSGPVQRKRRKELTGALASLPTVNLTDVRRDMESPDDALDAVVCALAGAHFLEGICYEPGDSDEAEHAAKEGWIWTARKRPGGHQRALLNGHC